MEITLKYGLRIKVSSNTGSEIWEEINHTYERRDNQDGESKKIKRVFEEGEYEGQMKNGKFHGEGTYKWKNGDVYEG